MLLVNTVYAEDNITSNFTAPATDDFSHIQNLIDNASSGDSIHLENKTYEGNGSFVHIDKDISIYGSDTILDGKEKSQIFVVSENVNVKIYGLTFVNGKTTDNGAAIDNYGHLTVSDSKFINNTAEYGTVRGSAGSSLTIINSLFEGNYADGGGGAIDSYQSDTKVINCSFIKNYGHEGGGIYNRFSDFQLINSTFICNSATRGGGIYNNRGYLVIRNSKFYSNSASHISGGIKSWGVCDIYDCDVRNNSGQYGGGIYISGYTMHVKNTTVANNVAEEGGGLLSDSFGALVISDSTIINNRADVGGGINSDCGQLNVTNCVIANNVANEKGGGISSKLGMIAKVRFNCYLQDVVLENNSAANGGGLYFGDILGKFDNVELTNNSATKNGGAIYNTGKLTFNRFTINHNAAAQGVAIYNKGNLALVNSNLSYNHADTGNVIYNEANLDIYNSLMAHNSAGSNGGVIYNLANFNVYDSIMEYNSAGSNGGVAYNLANLNIYNSVMEHNHAELMGGVAYNFANLTLFDDICNYNDARYAGVIYNEGNLVSVVNSSFEGNTAKRGAVISTSSDLRIDKSKFEKNIISSNLGVISVFSGNVNISSSEFNQNTGSDEGGVIFNIEGNILIVSSKFTSNKAKSHGGAIDNNANLTIIGSLFDENQAYGAGAIDNGGNLTIINSKFTNNKATKNGGAIDNNDILNIVGSIFEDNVAGGEGGAIIARKDINLTHSSLYNNRASVGDAIYVNNNNSNLTNNWWGSNNPDFERLLNKNISDDFHWIIMDFKNNACLIENENSNIVVSLNEVKNINNQSLKLNSPELLPDLEMILSTGDVLTVENGFLSKSIHIPSVQNITLRFNNLSITLNVSPNPGKNIDDKSISEVSDGGSIGADTKKATSVKILLKAKNKTVKKAKKIKYSATLKISNGKPVKGKKVTFKIKGKTYSAKTNKKGVATVIFKKLKAGKYKITVKYLKLKVKTILKVKK